MKGERRLRLVPPPIDDEQASISEEERAESDAFAEALHAAYAPEPLDEADLDAILARGLGDEAAATRVERDAAERLQGDLDGGVPQAEGVLFGALRNAAAPGPLAPEKNDALIAAALARRDASRRTTRRMAPVTMAALASMAALAAGISLVVGRPAPQPSAVLIRARSAEHLFDAAKPFPRMGEESARIDRIALARAGDLRNNRFASWGVR